MNNWRYRLFQFMQGRYGMDEFGRFLLIVTEIVILLSNFRHLHFLYLAGLLLLVYTYFRIMSRTIAGIAPASVNQSQLPGNILNPL